MILLFSSVQPGQVVQTEANTHSGEPQYWERTNFQAGRRVFRGSGGFVPISPEQPCVFVHDKPGSNPRMVIVGQMTA